MPGVKKPVQARSKGSTDQMLAAALHLLDEGGLAAVTIAAVSKQSGQSNGTLYHRFGNRMGMIAAAQAQFLDEIEAESRAAFERASAEANDVAALRTVALSYVTIFSEHRRAFRALMIEGQDFELLRERGQATSHRVQEWAVAWLVDRFGCSAEQAASAVYLLLSAAMSRVIFDDEILMAQVVDDAHLVEALVGAVHSLVAP